MYFGKKKQWVENVINDIMLEVAVLMKPNAFVS